MNLQILHPAKQIKGLATNWFFKLIGDHGVGKKATDIFGGPNSHKSMSEIISVACGSNPSEGRIFCFK